MDLKTIKSEYDQEMPQSHSADQPMTPGGRGTEHKQSHDSKKTIKVKQLALSSSPR